ncbi:MAG: response regulator [Desulfovermiculus sp.]|nr:response regulator [Desulfovermiculus sp.]
MDQMKILFVEDVATDVEMARRELKKERIAFIDRVVDTEKDFEQALAVFQPDLIISDYAMPAFDGMRALTMARAQFDHIPFIVLTGSMNEETAVSCMKAGADDYVIKEKIKRLPFAVQEVLDKVQMAKEKERAENQLRESEEKYRILVENAGQVILVAQNGQIKFINSRVRDLLGYGPEEMLGRSFTEYIHPEDRETVANRHMQRVQGQDLPEGYTFRVVHRQGQTKWAEVNAVVIDWLGKPATLNFLTDITDRQDLENQLRQAQKMESVGRLAGGVAHDYNNMLSVIIGYTELALKETEPSDALHEDLQEILRAARRSSDITRQLLAFARKQTVDPQVLDLNEVVEDMLKILRRLIGEDIELAWRPGKDVWPVKMDPAQLDQILANLCVNARDAMTAGGRMSIQTGTVTFDQAYCAEHVGFVPGDFVLLGVSDNGCGMDEQIRKHIFEPFFTTKDRSKGTGLGLATVYGIVKQNQGFINVYSEPGVGTTFKIYLPGHLSPDVEKSKKKTDDDVSHSRGELVLVVEDEVSILKVTTRMLTRLGYTVLEATTPGRALELAREHAGQVHLLITDMIMPEMNGRDLADQLQALYPKLRVLFMSGYTDDVIAHCGILEPAVHFMPKPFSSQDLARKVREALEG